MRTVSKTSLCSSIALATALMVGAKPASAQVAGSLVNAGGASVSGGGSSIVLNNPQTTIQWDATGAPINGVRDFLPSGNTMAFSGASDFAVLNRVTSGTDMIGLNGTITSTVNGVKGGTVFFYNPNGIVVGGTAAIDVGSLGLTTSDPGSGNNWFGDFNGSAPTLTFSGVTNGTSQVDIQSGASIKSNGTNSFIAVVAPKITTAGTIKTDGDVALVAAEAATLSFSSEYDLYSIQVDVGTGVSDSLSLTGGSIGRNSAVETADVARRAYLVTVPKNDATTLLISGGASLGFDVANSAVVEGNSIVLSAGRDTAFVGSETPGGTISIEQSTFSSRVDGYATDTVSIAPTAGTTQFLGNAEFTAANDVSIDASTGDVLFSGSLYADVSHYGDLGMAANGGVISLLAANGHSLTVSGDADLNADGSGGYSFDDGIDGQNGTGGQISVTANGGQVNVGGLYVSASGFGGVAGSNATGGLGQGGGIQLTASDGGSISAGYVSLNANGEGGSTVECYSCGISGGQGIGGDINISATDSGSALSFGSTYLTASGSGGAGDVEAGSGLGGDIYLDLTGLVTADLGESAYLAAYGDGGYGLLDAVGGWAEGGIVQVSLTKADNDRPTLTGGYVTLDAAGNGGSSMNGNEGGVGTGGTAAIGIVGGNLAASYLNVSATGRGGYSWNAQAGDSNGGHATMMLDQAQVDLQGYLRVDASAVQPISEGNPAYGNISSGGTATFNATNSNINTNLNGQTPQESLWVGATATSAGGSVGGGGAAYGGTVNSAISGSIIAAGDVVFDVHGLGGTGYDGQGGYGQGGSLNLSLTDSSLTGGNLSLSAYGSGGSSNLLGGDASGGSVAFSADGATLDLATFDADADAQGGEGWDYGANAGAAYGGSVDLQLASTSLLAPNVTVHAEGSGGATYGSASGGYGQGGSASIHLLGNSELTSDYLTVFAGGYGGENSQECNDCSTIGGDAQGGSAIIDFSGGGNAFAAGDTLWIYASGIGGAGDAGGGNGQGNYAALQIGDDSDLTIGQNYIFADGVGGAGFGDGNGGTGTGGVSRVLATGAAGATISHGGPFAFHITAEGYGGDAEYGDGGDGVSGSASYMADGLAFDSATGLYVSTLALGGNSIGGNGGDAFGGAAIVSLTNGASATMAGTLEIRSRATGGAGLTGGSASAGGISVLADNSTLASGTGMTAGDLGIILTGWAIGGAGSGGNGGDAVASDVALRAENGGSIDSTAAHITSYAGGGESRGGTSAGNADAGSSRIVAMNGGSVTLSGYANVKADAVGGIGYDGADGGNASADSFALVNAIGGSVAIGGDLNMTVNRTGGDGHNGGSAYAIIDYETPTVGETYPVAEILSQGGTVTVGGLTTMTADSVGGLGSDGGTGGGAFGGTVSLRALNSAVAPSVISLGDTVMTATATAGDGGAGIGNEVGDGGDGGAGGDALGGMIFIQAMSLDGQITTGDLTLATTAIAGDGGDGGYGVNGGNGGQGGSVATNWSAGAINISLPSGGNPPGLPLVTNGFVHLGDISADTSAQGGNGGWGGYAYNGTNGLAGDGGYAQSGDFYSINRGGDLVAGNLTWAFDAQGGMGGYNPNESIGGNGGDASIGELILLNSNRFNQVDQRGTVTFGDIYAVGQSIGGVGLVYGRSLYTSSLDFETVNADTHLGSLTYQANASDGPAVEGYDLTSLIAVQNGSVQIDGGLSVAVPDAMAVWLDNGTLTAGSIDLAAGNFVHNPAGPPASFGTIQAGSLSINTGNDIIIDADLDITDSSVDLSAPGSIAIGSATALGDISLFADGGFVLSNDLDASGSISLSAAGDISTQGLSAGGDVTAFASGALSTGAVSSDGNVSLYGNGVTVSGPISALGGVDMTSYLSLAAGDISSGDDMTLSAAGDLSAGNLYSDYGIIDAYAGQNLSLASADSGSDLYLTADAGNLLVSDDSFALGGMELHAGGLAQTANLTAQATISVVGGAIDVGNVFAGADLGGGIGGLALNPGADIGLWSGSTIDAGDLFATARIGLAAPQAIAAGSIEAGDLVMILGGAGISTGPITAGGELYIGGYSMFALGYDPLLEDFDPTPVLALAPVATGGNVVVGGAVSATQVRAESGSNWSSGVITASNGPVLIHAAVGVTAGAVSATGNVELGALGGNLVTGNIDSGAQLFLTASGTIGTGMLHSAQDMSVNADGGINIGFATSDTDIVTLTSANGPVASGGADANAIVISSGGATSVTGALTSATTIDVYGDGNVSLTSASAPGTVSIASGGAISSSGLVQSGDVLTVDAVGSVGLQSASAANDFDISGTAVQLGALSAGYGVIDARGPLTVLGAWNVGSLYARSNDINFGPAGSFLGQSLSLTSTNTTGAAIGSNSGAAAGSFVLDNGELSLINAQFLQVYAQENASAIDLLIGNTTLAGGGRSYDFGVIDAYGAYSGRLRVTGQVTGQNFGANDYLDLDARLMEVDAVNGGIDFSPGSDATLGNLSFYGERIHVAEASVLDRLAADPNYANRDLDLATAPSAAHNETTINVGTVNAYLFQPGQGGFAVGQAVSPYSIYVQNMGSNGVRSGLLIADANLVTDGGPGSVDMILNGKLVDPQTGQVLSGAAARDAFVADPENDLTLFTTSSSINGCALTGGGCFTPVPPAPPPTPQVEDLANQFVFLDTTIGDMLVFGDDPNSDDEDEDQKSDDKNAIDPPPAVINGKPLDPQTPTDEPVSGGGNPALIGTGSNQQEQQ